MKNILAILVAVLASAVAAPAQPAAPSYKLPATLVTSTGRTYQSPKLIGIEPDGLSIEYAPAPGAKGLAKVKFADLPESIQQQFGYDAAQASTFEAQRKQAQQDLTVKMIQAEASARTQRQAQAEADEKAAAEEAEAKKHQEEEAAKAQAEADAAAAEAAKTNQPPPSMPPPMKPY